MPEEAVDLVRRAVEAYNRRDVDAFMETWTSDAVVDWSNSRGLEARVFRGHDEIAGFMESFLAQWEGARLEFVTGPIEIKPGVVIAENVAYLRGRDGIEVTARATWLITVRNGKQTSLKLFQRMQEALDAAARLKLS